MTLRFTGTSTHKVDTKGRVSIPAPFRRVLEAGDPTWSEGRAAGLYINHPDKRQPFVTVYTVRAMEEIYAQIEAMPRGSRNRQLAEMMYNARSTYLTVDETGRLVLPQHIRTQLDLEAECVFRSGIDTFQILKAEAAEPAEQALDDFLAEQPLTFHPAELLMPGPPGADD